MVPFSLDEQRMELAQRAAAILYRLGASRVWLFGSLGRGAPQDRRSDLDLAVEGLPPGRLHQGTFEVARLAGFHVDVLDAQTMSPNVRVGYLASRVLMPRDAGGLAARPATTPLHHDPGARVSDPRVRLQQHRLEAVAGVLQHSEARRVIDLGCGSGQLLALLAGDARYEVLTGVDLSQESLDAASRRLARTLPPGQYSRVSLFLGVVTHRDPRLLGYDAAVAVEVIEHMDPPRLAAFEHAIFDYARPAMVVITTPNFEYNVRWSSDPDRHFRHPDHRFEWTRAEFRAWMEEVSRRTGYQVSWAGIGPEDPEVGPPTQMAVFSRPPLTEHRGGSPGARVPVQ